MIHETTRDRAKFEFELIQDSFLLTQPAWGAENMTRNPGFGNPIAFGACIDCERSPVGV